MRHLVSFRIYESKTSSGLTSEQEDFLNRYTQGTWSVNPTTGLVDIEGDLRFFSNTKLKSFFGVEFGNVTGRFLCLENQLQSLEGAPREVGYFNCVRNELQSLEGAPQKVRGSFECQLNKLRSLEGAPREIGGSFNCHSNLLQSLVGAPQKVGGKFYCAGNQLQSLEGAPREVGHFNCSYNNLQSLEGGPQKVEGDFYTGRSDGDFNCSYNELRSLAGAPEKVNGNFHCEGNNLQSLAGAPKEIDGSFHCDKFELRPRKWNMEGWTEILENGSEEAKKLIITLPYFDENFWNSKISENPESTIIQLSGLWDFIPEKVRNSIQIPSDLRDDFENLLELVRSGIM